MLVRYRRPAPRICVRFGRRIPAACLWEAGGRDMSKFGGARFGVAGFRRLGGALVAATIAASAFFCVVGEFGASSVPVSSRPASAALTVAPTFDNTTYLGSNARTGFDAAETAINPATAASLAEAWSAPSQGNTFVSSQVITSGGVAFWGDKNAYE